MRTGDKSTNITLVIDPLDLTVNPSLPNGQVGKTYTASIGVSGAWRPTTWCSMVNCQGLSLDLTTGAITGTPTKTQISTFSVTVRIARPSAWLARPRLPSTA
ncbi:Ig domain-containing protein [Comamonas sp. JC664]|uniref:Ig domain-containing protein n=1 Tax=Comamonas sp. JC664 TaxID=2801917 RepID=UPI00361A7D28